MSVGGKQKVRVCACAWVVEDRIVEGVGVGGGVYGVPKWWLARKDDG